jgi:hypothetical protein
VARWARCSVSDECRVDMENASMVAWHGGQHPKGILVPNRRLFAEEQRERSPGERLFKRIGEYLRDIPREVPWLWRPLVYFGGVSMLAGIWKGGKSELAAGLIRARLDRVPFLGAELPPGPTFLITEEGGISMAEKYDGYDGFEVVDRRDMEFEEQTLDDVLESIREEATDAQALVVIDTFVVMSDVEEENSATEVTKAIRKVMNWAQRTRAAVLIIDHTGKQTSGLNHGRSIRGSGAKPATLDIYGVLDYGPTQTQRTLATEGRVKDAREKLRLDFDPAARAYTLLTGDTDETKYDKWSAGIPMTGDGMDLAELGALWRLSPNPTKERVDELVKAGRMRSEFEKVGRTRKWLHWAVLPMTSSAHPGDEEGDE